MTHIEDRFKHNWDQPQRAINHNFPKFRALALCSSLWTPVLVDGEEDWNIWIQHDCIAFVSMEKPIEAWVTTDEDEAIAFLRINGIKL